MACSQALRTLLLGLASPGNPSGPAHKKQTSRETQPEASVQSSGNSMQGCSGATFAYPYFRSPRVLPDSPVHTPRASARVLPEPRLSLPMEGCLVSFSLPFSTAHLFTASEPHSSLLWQILSGLLGWDGGLPQPCASSLPVICHNARRLPQNSLGCLP